MSRNYDVATSRPSVSMFGVGLHRSKVVHPIPKFERRNI